ncbi:PIG-X [Rhodofomes roseus]|uniref:Protein PBN1 n=1 Tax=Rhodofomes roseus TaxID=34475 RepID=A0ABQ8K2L7_9APHY|nr:PIG-X [Rhodofomes roseus]KAH9830977.1 PIG-X [Rhodofomes roseus]
MSRLFSSLDARGFHFTYTTRLTLRDPARTADCTLHLLHVLPPDVYADQYELVQRPGFSVTVRGTSDLELPVGAVGSEGSVLLLDVEVEERREAEMELVIDVPLHARYGNPSAADKPELRSVQMDRPVGFWACPSSSESYTRECLQPSHLCSGSGSMNVPHEIAPHIQPDMFTTSSLSIIPHSPSVQASELVIPVGNLTDLAFVDVGTAITMLLCFLYLAVVSVRTARRLYQPPNMLKTE